jgi:hypothetical protein
MTENRSDLACSHCQSNALAVGVNIGKSVDSGWVGPNYKDGLLLIGTEPLLADLCTNCGHIQRLYVQNPNHKWISETSP